MKRTELVNIAKSFNALCSYSIERIESVERNGKKLTVTLRQGFMFRSPEPGARTFTGNVTECRKALASCNIGTDPNGWNIIGSWITGGKLCRVSDEIRAAMPEFMDDTASKAQELVNNLEEQTGKEWNYDIINNGYGFATVVYQGHKLDFDWNDRFQLANELMNQKTHNAYADNLADEMIKEAREKQTQEQIAKEEKETNMTTYTAKSIAYEFDTEFWNGYGYSIYEKGTAYPAPEVNTLLAAAKADNMKDALDILKQDFGCVSRLDAEEAFQLVECFNRYGDTCALASALSIVSGEEYVSKAVTHDGRTAHIVFPTFYREKAVSCEAEYFGTGTEYFALDLEDLAGQLHTTADQIRIEEPEQEQEEKKNITAEAIPYQFDALEQCTDYGMIISDQTNDCSHVFPFFESVIDFYLGQPTPEKWAEHFELSKENAETSFNTFKKFMNNDDKNALAESLSILTGQTYKAYSFDDGCKGLIIVSPKCFEKHVNRAATEYLHAMTAWRITSNGQEWDCNPCTFGQNQREQLADRLGVDVDDIVFIDSPHEYKPAQKIELMRNDNFYGPISLVGTGVYMNEKEIFKAVNAAGGWDSFIDEDEQITAADGLYSLADAYDIDPNDYDSFWDLEVKLMAKMPINLIQSRI